MTIASSLDPMFSNISSTLASLRSSILSTEWGILILLGIAFGVGYGLSRINWFNSKFKYSLLIGGLVFLILMLAQ